MTSISNRKRLRRASERGVTLIWAATSILVIAGVVLSGTDQLRAVDRVTKADFTGSAMSNEIARAGLVDTFAWFRRQATQPVETFAPARDLAATVPINETDDPSVGLIRTFEITPGVWGRYHSSPVMPAEAYTDANANGIYDDGEDFVDADGDGSWTPDRGTRDVSAERGLSGVGAVWHLVARAQVFRRPRGDLPVGVGENQQIGTSLMATEIRRLTLNPPASSALCVTQGSRISLGSGAKIRAGDSNAAVAYAESTGSPTLGGADLEGLSVAMPEYKGEIDDVFSVNWTELRSMADISTSDPAVGVPARIPNYALVVVSGDVSFNLERPLRGTGVVVVNGNCTIESGSNSFFNGVLYVNGDLTVRAPAFLTGTVVVTGTADIRAGGGDLCEIQHDPDLISRTLVRMGQYRTSKAPFEVSPYLMDGRPTELNQSKTRKGQGYAKGLTKTANPNAPGQAKKELIPGFSPDDLMSAIDKYASKHAGEPGTDSMIQANAQLDLANNLMAQDPPQTEQALAAMRDAMLSLATAVEEGATVASLGNDLYLGPNSLFPMISTMVDAMIQNSDAPAADVAVATTSYEAGNDLMDRGRTRLTTGNEVGAMEDYSAAAGAFRDAVNLLP